MATSIPAGTPGPLQHRKQIADEHGNFQPVPDEPQEQNPTTEEARGFKIGDAVALTGRVLEVQSPQGGQTSVKVQTPSGAAWFRGEHLEFVDETEAEARAALEYQVSEHQKQGAVDAERISELEGQAVAYRTGAEEDAAKIKAIEGQLDAHKKAADHERAEFEAQVKDLQKQIEAGKPDKPNK